MERWGNGVDVTTTWNLHKYEIVVQASRTISIKWYFYFELVSELLFILHLALLRLLCRLCRWWFRFTVSCCVMRRTKPSTQMRLQYFRVSFSSMEFARMCVFVRVTATSVLKLTSNAHIISHSITTFRQLYFLPLGSTHTHTQPS